MKEISGSQFLKNLKNLALNLQGNYILDAGAEGIFEEIFNNKNKKFVKLRSLNLNLASN